MSKVITSSTIKNSSEALLWLTDCTLASVAGLVTRKSASKYETTRQISMAQTAINWIMRDGLELPQHSRITDVIRDYGASVQDWADAVKSEVLG